MKKEILYFDVKPILLLMVVSAVLVFSNSVVADSVVADSIVIESRPGNVDFSHNTHLDVSCIECHHEMTSEDTVKPCRLCHQKTSKGKMNAKHAFHKSCFDCHLKTAKLKKKSGPIRQCSQCHKRN